MSSYISPAPQGDPKATGAYAVAIAATPGGTNNDGHATDSAGNVAVDFAWGNVPLQPNDVRNASVSNYGGSTGDAGWAQTTMVASTSLAYGNITKTLNNGITFAVKPDNHEIAEAEYSAYPSYVAGKAAYIITQASGDGSVQTYTAPNNFLKAGDVVNITGTGLDGNSLTVASANRYTFTVSGSGTGSFINISGKVRYADEATATDGAYIGGVAYVKVPNVIGQTTASAQDALNDAELTVTTASAATNSAKTVTDVTRTTGSTTIRFTASSNGYAAGNKVTVSGLDDEFNGTWTVVAAATNTFDVVGTSTASYGASGLSGSVVAVSGTIKSQSIAAGAASINPGAAITITPWA